MRPSQMQLDHYYFDELSFSLNDDYAFDAGVEEPKLLPEDLDVDVQPARHPEDPFQWMFKLRIQLENKDNKFPYTFSIRVTGFFDISKDCPTELVDRLALINAPSILYAASRELLAVMTGRSRMLTIFLPTVSFFEPPTKAKEDALISPPTEPKQLPKQAESRKQSGVKKAKKKKEIAEDIPCAGALKWLLERRGKSDCAATPLIVAILVLLEEIIVESLRGVSRQI